MLLVALLIVGGFAFYVMNSEERVRALRPVGVVLGYVIRVAALCVAGMRLYLVALLGRKRWALGSLGIAAVLLLTAGIHGRYLRSLTDIRPEIARLVAVEEKTMRAYDSAVGQFRLGAISAEALSKIIRQSVIPELQAIRLRLKSLDRIPAEHQPVLARADEYLHLRRESWRLRAEALEKRSMAALKKADRAERVSLEAYARVRLDDLQ